MAEAVSPRSISTKTVSTKDVRLMKGRIATETPGLEARTGEASTGGCAPEDVPATHMAAEIAASCKTAVPTGGGVSTATHLRRHRHQSHQQDERRNGMQATHASIISPIRMS